MPRYEGNIVDYCVKLQVSQPSHGRFSLEEIIVPFKLSLYPKSVDLILPQNLFISYS